MEIFRPHIVDPIQDVEGAAELLADERLRADVSVKLKQGRESDQGRGLPRDLHAPDFDVLRDERDARQAERGAISRRQPATCRWQPGSPPFLCIALVLSSVVLSI